MELTNEFVVAVPPSEAWAVLTDVEKIAPCMPGAELKEIEGDEYRGAVKVKVGPITASYRGSARFLERDDTDLRAVLKAEGRETRGQGNASATITATLAQHGDGTKVDVVTDLAITGKVAQFGRGVLAEVSGKLLDQFVHNLETTVLARGTEDEAAAQAATKSSGGDVTTPAEETVAAAGGAPTEGAVPELTAQANAMTDASGNGSGRAGEGTASDADEAPAPDPSEAASGVRRIESAPVEPVDLLEVAGPSMRRRLAPFLSVAGALFLLRIVIYALRRRKR